MMLKCELMKNGKCACSSKCAKLIWYEKGREDANVEYRDALHKAIGLDRSLNNTDVDTIFEMVEEKYQNTL